MAFGDFEWICRNAPSFPTCNLFFRQLLHANPPALTTLFPDLSSPSLTDAATQAAIRHASVGVDPACGLGRLGVRLGLGGIANVVLAAASIFVVAALIWAASRRKAAVGRLEFVFLLGVYLLTLPFQLLSANGIFVQGSTALAVLTALYLALLVAFFCILLANAIITLQVVEDGTMAALVPTSLFAFLAFAATLYVALDTAFGWTITIGGITGSPASLRSLPLFILTLLVPLAFALVWLAITLHVVLFNLREPRPALLFIAAGVLGVGGSALVFFLAGKPLCQASGGRVDGAFLATLLSTLGVGLLFAGHRSITESKWEDDPDDDVY